MPSTVVHCAVGALLGTALLADEFDARTLAFVLAVAALPDLDTFIGIVALGTHRAALHTLLVPGIAGLAVAVETRRADSWLRSRGPRTVRLAWVAVAVYALAGIGPDLFTNGVNAFYPVHDTFYRLSGNVLYTSNRGFVQTVWETQPYTGVGADADASSVVGNTSDTHYSTGVDPTRGPEPTNVKIIRVFPIAQGGLQVLLIVAATVVTTARLALDRNA